MKHIFIGGGNKVENKFIIYWEDGRCFSIDIDGNATELLYAHFFRRSFEVEECIEKINTIKVLPRKISFNKEILSADYEENEGNFYKITYYINNYIKSIKKYGIIRTIERQIWTRDHNKYISNILRNKY